MIRNLIEHGHGSWSESDQAMHPSEAYGVLPLDPNGTPDIRSTPWNIELQSFDPPYLFFPAHATGFSLTKPDALLSTGKVTPLRGSTGDYRYQPSEHGVEYQVYVDPSGKPTFRTQLSEHEREVYLHLPPIPERIRELAKMWVADASTPREAAKAIEHHLLTEYKYDLNTPAGKADDPLDDFLFESKRGHCEFYSTALAVMLRSLGVPTRTVNGFAGGSYNRFGKFYVVHQGDAHSWTEVYIDGEGWVTFDPTPPIGQESQASTRGIWATMRDLVEATSERWDRHVVNYDIDQQYSLLKSVSKDKRGQRSSAPVPKLFIVVVLVGVGLLVGVYFYARRGRPRARAGDREGKKGRSEVVATALYENLELAMGAQGIHRPPGTPPLRHAEALENASHPLAAPIMAVTRDYLSARFGGTELSEERITELTAHIREVKSANMKALNAGTARASNARDKSPAARAP